MATTMPMSGLTSRNPWARLLQGLVSGASLFADGVVSGREAEEKRKDSELARKAKKLEIEKNTPPAGPKQGPEPMRAAGADSDPPWAGGFPRPSLGPRLEPPVIPDPYAPKLPQLPEFGAASGGPEPRWSYRGAPRDAATQDALTSAGIRQVSSVPTRERTARGRSRRPVTPSRYAALVRNGVSQYAEHVGRDATAEERRDIEALIARKISAGQFT